MHIHHFTRTTRHLLFWTLILSALILSAVRIVLADISNFKAELEQEIRTITHIPVRVGSLSTRMRNFSPGLVLHDISIDPPNSDSKPAIQLKEIRIAIDLLNMLTSRNPMSAIRISLVGAKIDVQRNPDGSIAIKGLAGGKEQPIWLLEGNRYEILQSDVSWQDLKAQGKQISFHNFNLVLKNHQQNHEIHLVTKLPEQYGDSLRISALLNGNIFEADKLAGRLYLEAVNLQGPALTDSVLPLDLKMQTGSGDVRIWSDWQDSRPYRIAGYVQAQQIKMTNPSGNVLKLDTFEGNLNWLEKEGSWRLAAYDIDIAANHQFWKDGEFYLRQDNAGNWSGLLKKLDLQALAYIAPLFLTADQPISNWLQLNPSGKISNLTVYAQADLQHYALQGEFSELGNNAGHSMPRLKGLTGRVNGSDSRGRIDFASEDVLIDAPDFFRNYLTIKRLAGGINWLQQSEDWQISSRDLTIDSPDFKTGTDFDLTVPKDRKAARLDMQTRFGNFTDISRIPLYFPAKVMDKDALKWMDQAFIAGQIHQGEIVIRGNLDQFPFDNGQGVFETIFSVENGELQYNPDWPHVYDMNADIHFLGKDLRVAINSGTSENVDIKQMLVSIDSMVISEKAGLKGQLQSKLQNALLFLQKTPLHTHVDPLLKLLNLESTTQVDLDLTIPYHENQPFGIDVNAHLHNARLTFNPVNLKVNNINGNLKFTEDRISSDQLTATALGFPIQGQVSSDNMATRLRIDGSSSIDNLKRQFSFLENNFAGGVFSYQAALTIPNADGAAQTLTINSNLQGVGIDTKDFLMKAAEERRPLAVDFQFDHDRMLPVQLRYGSELNAALLIDTEQNRLHSGHVVIGGNTADTWRQAGLSVEIRQPEFKLSQAFSGISAADPRWPALQEILLNTEQLVWQGQKLGPIHCHFQHLNQDWQGEIDSSAAKGRLSIPDQHNDDDPIKLDLDFLNLSALSSLNLNAAEEDIVNLPLIDIDSRQLIWRSVNLGKLKLQTERLNNGIHFKKIKLKSTDKEIDLTADWINQPHGASTLISGALKVDNFGQFLSELGYSDDFKETHAEISFTGGWNGAPQQFSMARLNGQLQVKLRDGRISSIEPGFGRLLGLIAMEQWAKRLSLDFSDIYRQGLAFDKITGDFVITNGNAVTDNLLVNAVAANMRIAGTTNLANKTLDNRVAVIPKSSDALPIAGTIVGGVAAIITNALTGDYQEGYFFGSEYRVAGHWGDIEVTPVKDRDGLLNKTWQGLTDFGWLK